ncbi:MAG: ATP-NAD kinase family protein [Oscillospiraceae bacterium]|nr:ATP-NAD kinase family protein [Oscillospiraceae bacterium]
MNKKKLGLIINPVAGLGGSVGLKGSDNMVEEALARGAVPQSEKRTRVALQELLSLKDSITIYTGSGSMGELLVKELGFPCTVIAKNTSDSTTAEDTQVLVQWMQTQNIDLILFAGGDGTARDICRVADEKTVFLGIPTGVKIHSPVYARSSIAAGRLAFLYLQDQVENIVEEEVLDIDEEQYRQEMINTKLYGCLRIPKESEYTQCRKCGSSPSEEDSMAAIADYVADTMQKDTFYLIGAGTTTRAVMRELELDNTLIGVDLVYNYDLIAKDIYGKQILEWIGDKPTKLIVTVTGGQGFLFGRGNQQLTPDVLHRIGKENIIILATKEKILKLRGQPLLVDTGDAQLDQDLSGYYHIICDYNETIVCKVSPA